LIHTERVQPAPDEIRRHLDRILSSEPFANAERLSRFLRYAVERTLAGEGDRLKEYVIGTEVFDKGDRYDPRLDSIVRVEAGRLRAKLDEYYNRHGLNDTVVIGMPRGSYTPVFEQRQAAPPARLPIRRRMAIGVAAALLVTGIVAWGAARWAPVETRTPRTSIAVLPFAAYSTDQNLVMLAARLTDGVTSELARLGTLAVVSHTSALQFAGARKPLKEMAQALNADVVMEASVTADGDRVQVQARLVDAATDRKIWVEDFRGSVTDVQDLQRRIGIEAAAAVPRSRR